MDFRTCVLDPRGTTEYFPQFTIESEGEYFRTTTGSLHICMSGTGVRLIKENVRELKSGLIRRGRKVNKSASQSQL